MLATVADQLGAQSLTAQLRARLVERIRAGEFTVGQKIPSLRALMDEYDMAEGTVHSAIRDLQYAGVLESSTGRGTFVKRVPDPEEPSADEALAELKVEVADLRDRVEALERGHSAEPG